MTARRTQKRGRKQLKLDESFWQKLLKRAPGRPKLGKVPAKKTYRANGLRP